MSSKRSDPVGSWKPSEARNEFRTNPALEGKSSSGYCLGFLQANLAILPSSLADDFEQFCELNKAPCPLLYRSGIGELSAGNLAPDSDVRYVLMSVIPLDVPTSMACVTSLRPMRTYFLKSQNFLRKV